LNAFAFFECLGFERPGFEYLGSERNTRRTELAEKAGFRLRQAGYVMGRTFVGAQVS
jgi:hypothetical protein